MHMHTLLISKIPLHQSLQLPKAKIYQGTAEILTLNRKGHGLLELAIVVQHAEWFVSLHLNLQLILLSQVCEFVSTQPQCQLQVFVPFNLWGCHWCLLVVNNTKKEIQILNSLASVPHFRDEKKEITMVTS